MKNLVLPEIEAYAEGHSAAESDVCRQLREETQRTMALPQMVVGPLEGAFLKMMARMVGATRVLEIGTFTGYSALCFAEAIPDDGQVITCDIDLESTALAKTYWAQSAEAHKIELKVGPALETMEKLSGQFDVIFVDADKSNYVKYYQKSKRLLSENGVMLIDNVLWNGEVLKRPPPDEDTETIQALNRMVTADTDVYSVLVPIRDGVMIVKPRPRS